MDPDLPLQTFKLEAGRSAVYGSRRRTESRTSVNFENGISETGLVAKLIGLLKFGINDVDL